MKLRVLIVFTILTLGAFSIEQSRAQRENGEIRSGNDLYVEGDYKSAEVAYRSALQINADSYSALSNLGASLFRQGLSADAEEIWGRAAQLLAKDSLKVDKISEVLYNIGNAQLAQRMDDQTKLDAAIESYKQSLRLNPSFEKARYNLAYAQALKQDDDGGGGQDDQNQDNKDNEDNQENQDKDNKEDNQDKQDKDNKEDEQQNQESDSKPKSRIEAERMADAIQRAEDRTKQKVDREREREAVGTSSTKSW